MLSTNPFAELSAVLSPDVMQGYVVLMVVLVIVGTILDMMHKKSPSTSSKMQKKHRKVPSALWAAAKKHR